MATFSMPHSSKHDKVTNKSEMLIRFDNKSDSIFALKVYFTFTKMLENK